MREIKRKRPVLTILAPDGRIVNRTAYDEMKLAGDELQKIYERMLRTRIFNEVASSRAMLKQLVLFISGKGQEASQVASASLLGPEDWIFWYYRSWGAAIARGISAETLLKRLCCCAYAPETADELIACKSMQPYILVGNNITHAVGFAWSKKLWKENSVAVTYFGDGASATPDFHGGLNFAAIHSVPIVFICENNGIAVSTPTCLETLTPIAEKAASYGIKSFAVEGRDPLAVAYVMRKALALARDSQPIFVEALVDRMDHHTNAIGVETRTKEELRSMECRDPIKRTRLFLLSEEARRRFGIEWNEKKDTEIREQIEQETRAAADIAYAALGNDEQREKTGQLAIGAALNMHKNPATRKRYLNGKSSSEHTEHFFRPKIIKDINCCSAFGLALYNIFRHDPETVYMGEDISGIGGVFRNTGIHKDLLATLVELENYRDKVVKSYLPLSAIFCEGRFLDTPLDEYSTPGIAVGIALNDKPVF